MAKKARAKIRSKQVQLVEQAQSANHWAVSKYLDQVKFSTRLIGVDEADIWKKIEKLCQLYENALTEERGKAEKLACQLNAHGEKRRADADIEERVTEEQPNG